MLERVIVSSNRGGCIGCTESIAAGLAERGQREGDMPWQWEGDVRAMRAMLGFPGWYDWHWASGGENYQRMIYSRIPEREWPIIRQLIRRDPSHLWLVLNEPERGDQANLSPAEGAHVAQRMSLVGARIAVPGVILTVDGFAWLEGYLEAGGPVPDALACASLLLLHARWDRRPAGHVGRVDAAAGRKAGPRSSASSMPRAATWGNRSF